MAEEAPQREAWLHCTGCGREVKCAASATGQAETCPYCGTRGTVGGGRKRPEPGTVLPGAVGAVVTGLIGLLGLPLTGLLWLVAVTGHIPFLGPPLLLVSLLPLPMAGIGIGAIVLARGARKRHAASPDAYAGIHYALVWEVLGWSALAVGLVLLLIERGLLAR
jgi:hypothetical protein